MAYTIACIVNAVTGGRPRNPSRRRSDRVPYTVEDFLPRTAVSSEDQSKRQRRVDRIVNSQLDAHFRRLVARSSQVRSRP